MRRMQAKGNNVAVARFMKKWSSEDA